jgi:two-component system response regulator
VDHNDRRPEVTDMLLVEDSAADAQLTLHALRNTRIANRIRVVRDGAEALEYLFSAGVEIPKLVLLDLKLPRVDGVDVLRAMRRNPRTRTMPVVILTSSQEERDIAQAYALGVNSYVVKPLDFEQFTSTVRQVALYWVLLNQQAQVNDLECFPLASPSVVK